MPERQYLYKGRILNLALEGPYEIVEHAHAVAILVERDGRILFVRQYRPAVGTATLEIPAGLIDPGETPEEAARRELAEEAQLAGDMSARLANVAGAFAANPELARGRRVVLVDDVFTTGATLLTCAEALRAAGAAEVFGLTLARARS